MSVPKLRRHALAILAVAGCAADFETTRVEGRPAAEVRQALLAPSSYAGPATTIRVGLGEAASWELLCPGRLSLLSEDDPADRVLVTEGRTVRASLARAQTGVAGSCPTVEVAGDARSIDLEKPLAFFRELGFQPRLETAGSRFALVQGGKEGALDRRRTRIVLEPCAPQPEAEATCRWIRETYQRGCTVLEGVVRPAHGQIALTTSRGVDIATWPNPVKVRCEGADTLYLRETGSQQRRSYRGALILTPGADGGLLAMNELGLEEYVKGVVPKETYPNAPAAALEAQAIAARSIVIHGLGRRHRDQPYDICSTTHCQVYGGLHAATPATDRAVTATEGLVLVLGGEPIEPVYHAVCGGRTERNEIPWPGQPPHVALRGALDRVLPKIPGESDPEPAPLTGSEEMWSYLLEPPPAFCAEVGKPGRFRWTRSFRTEELSSKLDPEGLLGEIIALVPEGRGFSGRATALRVRGTRGSKRIEGELTLRRALGSLPSSAFEVETLPSDDEAPPGALPKVFVLVGAGHGHGAGMCQLGAIGMARQGYDSAAILAHYYAGARALPMLP